MIEENLVDVSIIIPCKNESNNLIKTIDSIICSRNSLTFEIIVIDDGSTDLSTDFLKYPLIKNVYKNIHLIKTNSLGCAGARNAGAKIARGKYLVFCDGHIKVQDRWLDSLVNTLKDYNVSLSAPRIWYTKDFISGIYGYGATWTSKLDYIWLPNVPTKVTEIPFSPSITLCITKDCFYKIHGFDTFFWGYGVEDLELCIKAWLYGYKLVINPFIEVKHLLQDKHRYKITFDSIIYNNLCLAYSHFKMQRVAKTINIFKSNSSFPSAANKLKANMTSLLKQREKYFTERIYSDDDFFQRFSIDF